MQPADVALPARGDGAWSGAGGGFAAYPELASRLAMDRIDADIVPDARAIGELAQPGSQRVKVSALRTRCLSTFGTASR